MFVDPDFLKGLCHLLFFFINREIIDRNNEIQHGLVGHGKWFLNWWLKSSRYLLIGWQCTGDNKVGDQRWDLKQILERPTLGWLSLSLIYFCALSPHRFFHHAQLLVCCGWVKKRALWCCRATVQQLRRHLSVRPVKSALIRAQQVCPCPAELW